MPDDHPKTSSSLAQRLSYSPRDEAGVAAWTDTYFKRTKQIVGRFGDSRVTYALFMRRPVVCAPRLAVEWLQEMAAQRGFEIEIELLYPEGKWVGAGEPILYVTGPLYHLSDLETLLLQKLGPPSVAAYNAYTMCADLPKVGFLAMEARHCAGTEMTELMVYAASVGSARARRKVGAVGFVGTATDATAHFLGKERGIGTMPHALIGYAGSTVRAAEMFAETFPDDPLVVLVDYFAQEVTDSLAVCRRFAERAARGEVSLRIDVPGSRYLEGLDPAASYAVLERNAPDAVRGYRTDDQLRNLVGPGVSAAAIWSLREALNAEGFDKVRIVGSSGFGPEKCRIMAEANAPLDLVGTGSYLPSKWSETYATADIVAYDGQPRVKVGREFLLRR
ncbi:nicotinate phosphoribosyltransferase [Algihabitans albus]|uniref:nicotinate phosphoribosyltransferase n=1 Tax=Algihabitans albus TaxID=2164067 RepID=UPI0035D08882